MQYSGNVRSKLAITAACWMFVVNPVFGALHWDALQVQQTARVGDKKSVAHFRFKNDGGGPVTITSVKPSCGCTTAELGKRTYAPGESGEITATFTFESRTGIQQKTITVVTDDPAIPPTTLFLRVTIEESFSYTPHSLLWDIKDAGLEKDVIVSPSGSHKIVSLTAESGAPAEFAVHTMPESDGSYRLHVRPVSALKATSVIVTCVATMDNAEQNRFQVYALVR